MSSRFRILLALPPLVFLGIFYFYPLFAIFRLGFAPEGAWEMGKLGRLVSAPYYWKVLWFTVWQAALSTLLTLCAALPAAYVFSRYDFRGKTAMKNLLIVPFVLPTVVTAVAFKALLGPGGIVNAALAGVFNLESPPIKLDQTVWFFLTAHVFYNCAIVIRIVGDFWERLPEDVEEAARMLGASGFETFCKITLPLLAPAILAASVLVFVFCFTSFGVVLILGGPRMATLEVEIYRQAVHLFNLPMAAALSLVQILFTFCCMAVYIHFEKRSAISLMPQMVSATKRRIAKTRGEKVVVRATLSILALLLGAPPAALVVGSLRTETGFSPGYYAALFSDESRSILFVPPVEAVVNSVGFAVGAALIAVLLGGLSAAYLAGDKKGGGAFLDSVFMLPLSTSAVTLGFGFIVALDEPPLNLRTSVFLPAVAHAMVAFPFVLRSILPAWRSIPDNLREAAAVLGASPWRVWRHVDWPVLSRALVVGAIFAFAVSMGEFGAAVFVARPETPTMPLAIFRFLGRPGAVNYGQAMAMSTILMFAAAAGFLALEKIRNAGGKS